MVASKIVLACFAAFALDSVTSVYGVPVKAELLSSRDVTVAGTSLTGSGGLTTENLGSNVIDAAGGNAANLPVAGSLVSTGLGTGEGAVGGATSLAPGGVLQRSVPGVNLAGGNPALGGTGGNLANSAIAEVGGLAGTATGALGGVLPVGAATGALGGVLPVGAATGALGGVTGGVLPGGLRRRGGSGPTVAGVPVESTVDGLKDIVSKPPVAANTGDVNVGTTKRDGSKVTIDGVPAGDASNLANPAGAAANLLTSSGGLTSLPNGLPLSSGALAGAGGLAGTLPGGLPTSGGLPGVGALPPTA